VKRAIALVVAAALLGACGTTHVVPTDPNARIYVDGQMVGQGVGAIRQRGLPGGAQVLVITDDGRRQQQPITRSFTIVTFLLGLITYGVCWVACWEYPAAVMVNVPPPAGGYTLGATAADSAAPARIGDPWLQAPPGWRPHDAPAPPPR
jgi:hypothetical protein